MNAMFAAALVVAAAAAVRGLWSPCGMSMLSALNPLAESARGHRFTVTAAWYVIGAVVGGALLGVGNAILAWCWHRVGVPDGVAWALAGGAALVSVSSDLRILPVTLPIHPRQVDAAWLSRYRRWVYAAGFGVQIGAGFATYIMTAATYLLVVLAALTSSPTDAITVGLVFGLVRGLTVFAAPGATSPPALRALMRRVDQLDPYALRTVEIIQLGVAAVATFELAGPLLSATISGLGIYFALMRRSRTAPARSSVVPESARTAGR